MEDKVTYVVDADLVRFAKFAIATLGIFIVVGISLFGFSLKDMAKQLSDARDQLNDAEAKLQTSQARIDAAQVRMDAGLADLQSKSERVQALQLETEGLKRRAETAVQSISIYERQSRELLVAMQAPGGPPVVQAVESSEVVATGMNRGRLWDNGTQLRAAFIGGDEAIRQLVQEAAAEWTKYANLSISFDADPDDADIRIGFRPGDGNWSYIGRDALTVGANSSERTMNVDPSWPDGNRLSDILVPVGHAIGLLKEHQNPNADIPWDRQAVFKSFGSAPYFWSRDAVEFNLFKKWRDSDFPLEKPYDPHSIMHYKVRNEWTSDDFEIEPPKELSEGDKEWISRLYPKEG
ncbi:MAG: hypothetical protein QNJ92_17035 [Alphaproteobacteria bacterium]|nr:hypothetical protein [Alphaproteobacteria bacterium]